MTRIFRSSVVLLVAALGVGGALPAAALAQHGNGLYEPFPKAAVKERAKRFIERLPLPGAAGKIRFSDEELARGVFVDPRAVGVAEDLRLGSSQSGSAGSDGASRPAQADAGDPSVRAEGGGSASARAGANGGDGDGGLPALVQIALVLLAVVALPVLAARRPRRRGATA
jgi:hypothetical protein